MMVHLPDMQPIPILGNQQRWDVRLEAFGKDTLPFWHWQERTADFMWELALRLPPWPPQNFADLRSLASKAAGTLLEAPFADRVDRLRSLPDSLRTLEHRLAGMPDRFRMLIDAQLLISAQARASSANALYAAAALDLPRRGVAQPLGGMGQLAEELKRAVERQGGEVLFRHKVTGVVLQRGKPVAVETQRKGSFPADIVIANLPSSNLAQILGDGAPAALKRSPQTPKDGWGAFTLYLGLDRSAAAGLPLHHQVLTGRGWGEGDSIYLSLSPEGDSSRAPAGRRAMTISTHTRLEAWRSLKGKDRQSYNKQKDLLTDRVLASAERAIPGIREAAELVLPGTPLTFERFTNRPDGWVGGFPQTHLLRARGVRIRPGIWMVGDSVFPGQSVAATALSGLRVGRAIHAEAARLDRKSMSSERRFRFDSEAAKLPGLESPK